MPESPKVRKFCSVVIPTAATQMAPRAEKDGEKLHPGCVQTPFRRETGQKQEGAGQNVQV